MHNHKKCKHKLEFCGHCDVVYCTVCKEEWKKNNSITWSGTTTGDNQIYIGTQTPPTTCSSEHKLNLPTTNWNK